MSLHHTGSILQQRTYVSRLMVNTDLLLTSLMFLLSRAPDISRGNWILW